MGGGWVWQRPGSARAVSAAPNRFSPPPNRPVNRYSPSAWPNGCVNSYAFGAPGLVAFMSCWVTSLPVSGLIQPSPLAFSRTVKPSVVAQSSSWPPWSEVSIFRSPSWFWLSPVIFIALSPRVTVTSLATYISGLFLNCSVSMVILVPSSSWKVVLPQKSTSVLPSLFQSTWGSPQMLVTSPLFLLMILICESFSSSCSV